MHSVETRRVFRGLTVIGALALCLGVVGMVNPAGAVLVNDPVAPNAVVSLDAQYDGMAVDPAANEVFVATGDELIKLSESGTSLGSVPLAIPESPVFAGGMLWVALMGASEVIEIDPATLRTVASYSVRYPNSIAADEGAIWVDSETLDFPIDDALVKIDPTTGVVSSTQVVLPGSDLEANPALPDQLVSWYDASPDSFALISVAGTSPVVLNNEPNGPTPIGDWGNISTLGFLPDGSAFIPMGEDPQESLWTLGSQSLEPVDGHYDTEDSPTFGGAVSSADGGVVLAESGDAVALFDITFDYEAMILATATNEMLNGAPIAQWNGTAISHDGTTIYLAVGTGGTDPSYALDIFNLSSVMPTSPATTTPDDGFGVPQSVQGSTPVTPPAVPASSNLQPSGGASGSGPSTVAGQVSKDLRPSMKLTPGVVRRNRAFTLGIRLRGARGVPGGKVLVRVGSRHACSLRLSKSGSASCRVRGLKAGSYSIVVSFLGSTRYPAFEKSERLVVRKK